MVNHPTYGCCPLDPTLVAIQWSSAHSLAAIQKVLTDFSLLPLEQPQDSQRVSEPSMPLTWTTAKPRQIRELFIKQKQISEIEWVAPVYRAAQPQKDGHTSFAINPTILHLTEEAVARLDGHVGVDATWVVQPETVACLKDSLVLELHNNHAIAVASHLINLPPLADLVDPVCFDFIPYIEPIPATVCSQAESILVCFEVQKIEQEIEQLRQSLLIGQMGELSSYPRADEAEFTNQWPK
jgi:hypothetical protein